MNRIGVLLSIGISIFSGLKVSAMGTETHGGDIIICYDRPLIKDSGIVDAEAQITQAVVKDYWEGVRESNYQYIPPIYKYEDPWKNIEELLFKFELIDYSMANRLKSRIQDMSANSFKNSIAFVEQGELPEVDDASSVLNLAYGSNCYDRQIAHQVENLGFGHKKIFISNKLFNFLDLSQKIGTLMHELLLEDFLMYGKNLRRNSNGNILTDPIRFINFLMVSNLYEDPNRNYSYLRILIDFNLFYFDEIYFNFQQFLFKISKDDLNKQYPEITATLVQKYWLLGTDDFILLDFQNSNIQGFTRLSLFPGSTLTLSLSEFLLKKATLNGAFMIESSLFKGRTVQTINVQKSNISNISFYKGIVINELELFKGADIYCGSLHYNEKESFQINIQSQVVLYPLSSPEYIYPCGNIRSKN